MNQSDLIIAMLEQVAEQAGDITPSVIERYFNRCVESKELMDHMDEHMLGRMMDQVLLLIMEAGEEELASYIEFETANHRAYGVEPHMYDNLLAALREVLSQALGASEVNPAPAAGTPAAEIGSMLDAYDARAAFLLERIKSAA